MSFGSSNPAIFPDHLWPALWYYNANLPLEVASYEALRTITSKEVRSIQVTGRDGDSLNVGMAGIFLVDEEDTTSADNGGIIIVDASGRRWKRIYDRSVNPAWFGASPTETAATNAAAIQAAADYCKLTGAFLVGSPGTFPVNATITMECAGDLSGMTISADGAAVSPVLRFGKTVGVLFSKKIILPAVANSSRAALSWGAGVGVELANCNACDITVMSVQDFAVGVDVVGYAQGFSYCDVFTRYVFDNKVNLRLKPKDAAAWVNENTFFGGRFGHTPSKAPSLLAADWVGSRDILTETYDNASAGGPNNNTFVRPSVESDYVEYMLDLTGGYNTFITGRYEGAAKKVRFFAAAGGVTSNNMIFGGYQAVSLVYTFAGAGDTSKNGFISSRENKIESSDAAFSIATGGGTSPHIQGFRAGQRSIGKSAASTDWTYRIYETSAEFKTNTDTAARIKIDYSNARIYFGDGTAAPTKYFGNLGTAVGVAASFGPTTDNANTNGLASLRWSTVYAGTGAINTSDAREKQQVREISEKERAAAVRCKGLLRAFKFNDAVEKKGNGARIHFGVIAQDVAAAFESEGLNANDYAMFCYDEWAEQPEVTDEHGNVLQEYRPAGSLYGIRYEELLAFIIAAI